jgi:hypothetical protein
MGTQRIVKEGFKSRRENAFSCRIFLLVSEQQQSHSMHAYAVYGRVGASNASYICEVHMIAVAVYLIESSREVIPTVLF